MNLLDKETYNSKGKDENEGTMSRKRKSLILGEEDTPDGKEENERTTSQIQKALIRGKKVLASIFGEEVTPNSKKATETPKSCFASIIPENIKLIYLRRSSVQDLLTDPETFECNVVGSYVRILSDPDDFSPGNSHQLLQVAGVKKVHECSKVGEECILQVIKLPLIKDIPIFMLSDEYFKKEECMDLSQRIREGSAYRPTVMEIQRKAQMLHKVITKQWLASELSLMQNLLLQNLIDRNNDNRCCATEKGWRNELIEYLKREAPLQKLDEQEEILFTVPNASDISCSLKSSIMGTSAGVDEEGNDAFVKEANASAGVDEEGNAAFVKEANGVLGVTRVDKLDTNIGSIIEGNRNSIEMNGSSAIAKNSKESEVNDVSEEDDNEQQGDNPDSALWYYKDPGQVTRGPFEARKLKGWKEKDLFPQDFKVWKHGQAPVLLNHMISQMFPN